MASGQVLFTDLHQVYAAGDCLGGPVHQGVFISHPAVGDQAKARLRESWHRD
jgi:hypothetical protein